MNVFIQLADGHLKYEPYVGILVYKANVSAVSDSSLVFLAWIIVD